jgi:hypothetical protein
MSWLFGLMSLLVSVYSVLVFHPFGNDTVNTICFITISVMYSVLLFVASDLEDKLKKRIETLEKKLEDREKGGVE